MILAEMLASWAKTSKWKGADCPSKLFLRITLLKRNSFRFSFSVGCLAGYSVVTSAYATASSYFFRYDLPDRVLDAIGTSLSAAITNFSSSESMKEVTFPSSSFAVTPHWMKKPSSCPWTLASNSSPLLVLDNVGVDPHHLASGS